MEMMNPRFIIFRMTNPGFINNIINHLCIILGRLIIWGIRQAPDGGTQTKNKWGGPGG